MTSLVFLFVFIVRAKVYLNWKRGVNAFLKQVSNQERQTLTLYAHTFELGDADKVVIEKWGNVKKMTITASYILLNCDLGEQYLFPAKSMDPLSYQALKEFIQSKMNTNPSSEK